jgi:hypothetical protein
LAADAVSVIAVLDVETGGAVETLVVVVEDNVIVTADDLLAETLPAASLAQAYAVCEPAAENVTLLGMVADQPAALAAGAVELDVTK